MIVRARQEFFDGLRRLLERGISFKSFDLNYNNPTYARHPLCFPDSNPFANVERLVASDVQFSILPEYLPRLKEAYTSQNCPIQKVFPSVTKMIVDDDPHFELQNWPNLKTLVLKGASVSSKIYCIFLAHSFCYVGSSFFNEVYNEA
jgi:hypothetical protein